MTKKLERQVREFESFRVCSSPGDIDTCIPMVLLLLDSEVWCLGLLFPLPDDLSSSPDDIEALLLSLFCFGSALV